MKLCTCRHDESTHTEEGVGYCIGNKPNGDPCDCERFAPDQVLLEIPAEGYSGSQYVGLDERQWIEREMLRVVAICICTRGTVPESFLFSVTNMESGHRRLVSFELVLSYWPWAQHQRALYYRAEGPFEFAGVPAEAWTVEL